MAYLTTLEGDELDGSNRHGKRRGHFRGMPKGLRAPERAARFHKPKPQAELLGFSVGKALKKVGRVVKRNPVAAAAVTGGASALLKSRVGRAVITGGGSELIKSRVGRAAVTGGGSELLRTRAGRAVASGGASEVLRTRAGLAASTGGASLFGSKKAKAAVQRAVRRGGPTAYFGSDSELLGFSVGKALKKVGKAAKTVTKPVAKAASVVAKPVAKVAVAAAKTVAKPVAKAAVGVAHVAARNPTTTLLMTGGTGAALLATTKKGRKALPKAIGNAAVAATVIPTGGASLLAKKKVRKAVGKAAVSTVKFAARHPTATMIATGGTGAGLLATTKKGRKGLKDFTGNAAVAATVVPTAGLSLLGKKKVRDFAKRHPYMAAAVNPASLLYTGSTKRGRQELAAPVKAVGNAVADVASAVFSSPPSSPAQASEAPANFGEPKAAEAPAEEKKSGILPLALAAGGAALMFI